jgi:hypothetical protein
MHDSTAFDLDGEDYEDTAELLPGEDEDTGFPPASSVETRAATATGLQAMAAAGLDLESAGGGAAPGKSMASPRRLAGTAATAAGNSAAAMPAAASLKAPASAAGHPTASFTAQAAAATTTASHAATGAAMPTAGAACDSGATAAGSAPAVAAWWGAATRGAWFWGPMFAAAVVGGTLWLISRGSGPSPETVPSAASSTESSIPATPGTAVPVVAAPTVDLRWVPDETVVLVHVRFEECLREPAFATVLNHAAPVGEEGLLRITAALRVPLDQVQEVTWACTASGQAAAQNVLVLKLKRAADGAAIAAGATAQDWKLDGAACLRRPASGWDHPYALVGDRTLVTGDEPLLRALATRSEPRLRSAALQDLLGVVGPPQHMLAVVDLGALRGWVPGVVEHYLADWPAGREAWRVVFSTPYGAALQWQFGAPHRATLHLLCGGDVTAQKVLDAVASLMAAAPGAIDAQLAVLHEQLRAGQTNLRAVAPQRTLLTRLRDALADAESGTTGNCVWFRVAVRGDLDEVARSAVSSVPQWERRRVEQFRAADEERHRYLMQGLLAYDRAEGMLPPGAAPPNLLPAERRLSWIAQLLPYYEQHDWYEQLEFRRPWNDPRNTPITRRALSRVVNPALGDELTDTGFPVTHYVGMAGLGADAAELPADHPRAGLFGYDRRITLRGLDKGASHTIALAGVQAATGAWAAGGPATVRGLAREPFINGPDGFGSGQVDGMFVAMADGSVRFLSSKIDPEVLRRMVVVHGPKPEMFVRIEPELPPVAAPPPTAVAPPPRVEPPVAQPANDWQQRLALRLPSVDIPPTRLGEVLDFVSQLTNVRINLDVEALADVGVTPESKVSAQLTDTTAGELLDALLAQWGLGYIAQDGQLLVTNTSKTQRTLSTTAYAVGDLADDDSAVVQLAALVQQFVEPTAWSAHGGPGHLRIEGNSLLIDQSGAVHLQVQRFLDKLRLARGLPVSRPGMQPPPTLATRLSQAREVLHKQVTANFAEPTPLWRVVAYLQQHSTANLLIDGLALRAAGTSSDTEVTLSVADQPLIEALDQLTRGSPLAFRVVGPRSVQITSRQLAEAAYDLEFYPLRDLVSAEDPPDEWIALVRSAAPPRSWNDAGGSGALYYDAGSRCLLVLHTQEVQFRIERLLASRRP